MRSEELEVELDDDSSARQVQQLAALGISVAAVASILEGTSQSGIQYVVAA